MGEPVEEDAIDTCPICAVAFKLDDLCLSDIEMGTCHAACLEGSPMVNLDTGEPLPEGAPLPTPYRYADIFPAGYVFPPYLTKTENGNG